MKEVPVKIKKGQYLSDVLKDDKGINNIPRNAIIDKTLPGLGATYMEIDREITKRNSIIIEPNVPVILGKGKKSKDVLAVWEDCKRPKIKKYLENAHIQYKKILTTPEGYVSKVRPIAIALLGEETFYNTYFCLFDESEKITQDVDYRKTISQPINDFLRFKDKAFVSATPLPISHPVIKETFQTYKVVPQYDYKKNINLISTNNFGTEVEIKLTELKDSKCICIFLNSTEGINRLVNSIPFVKKNYKIFCAKDSKKKLQELGFDKTYQDLDLPLAKYNFFTCRFFSALDIELEVKPDILILTNLNDARHSMIDPLTESIQIYGRFRDTYCKGELSFNSLTHIYNWDERIETKSEEEINEEINEFEITHRGLIERLSNENLTEGRKNAIEKQLNKSLYVQLLDENGDINYFSVDNLNNEERVKSYYKYSYSLKEAYEATNHFIVSYQFKGSVMGEDDVYRVKGKTFKDKCKTIIHFLDMAYSIGRATEIDITKEYIKQLDEDNIILDTYKIFGKQFIIESDYKESVIKKAIINARIEIKRLNEDVLKRIQSDFIIGEKYTTTQIIEILTKIYNLNGIEYTVKGTTLKHYFLTGISNGKTIPKLFYIDWEKFELPEQVKEDMKI